MPVLSNISDNEIAVAFTNTNFGTTQHRKLLEQGVLKKLVGFHSGHTLTQIMLKLGLIAPSLRVTLKGKAFLYQAFEDTRNSG